MVYDIGLGSNLGDRVARLQGAVDGLRSAGCEVIALSRVYETEPVGGPAQGPYLNAVVRVRTELAPRELLVVAHDLENEAGRIRRERWGPRTLDVDILRAGDVRVAETDLEIPHPRMRERGFVMVPLGDIDASVELSADRDAQRDGVDLTAHRLR